MTGFQNGKNYKYFDDCSAPMCPRDSNATNTAWFTDEPICRLHDVPDWVKRQRKIAKTGAYKTAGCFTLPILERRCIIGKKITGIDPDRTDTERKGAEKEWLDKHPPIKPKTRETREKLAARMRLPNANPSVV